MSGRRRRGSWLLAVALLSLSLQLVGPPGSTAVEPVRLMIIGDSVTHGSSGDWTWRYRLWEHLSATSAAPVDFVGPRDDLFDEITHTYGNHDYVDPDFDADHAARSGMSLAFPDIPVSELVETYQPDIVVEMLGVVDLFFYHNTPAQVAQGVTKLVVDARAANPDVSVVLAEIPQNWFPDAPEVNALLPGIAEDLDTAGSRVVVAATAAGYTRAGSTYDDSHPDANGELTLAAAVADALAGLGLGTAPARPLPAVPLGPRIPPVVTSSTVSDGTVTLTWRRSPGAQTSQVQQRDPTTGGAWVVAEDSVTGTSWSTAAPPPGEWLDLRLLPRKGWRLAQPDAASEVVTVRTLGLPGRPRLRVRPHGTGRTLVAWRTARADSYVVTLKSPGLPGWDVVADHRARPRLLLRGLRPGSVYVVRVQAENSSGTGPWSRRLRFVAT